MLLNQTYFSSFEAVLWVVDAPCVQKAVLEIYCQAITMRTFRGRLIEKNFVKELAARAMLERKSTPWSLLGKTRGMCNQRMRLNEED